MLMIREAAHQDNRSRSALNVAAQVYTAQQAKIQLMSLQPDLPNMYTVDVQLRNNTLPIHTHNS